jgi:hypothetical protein
MMAMCPSPAGSVDSSSAQACYKCGGKGHIKIKCPNILARQVLYARLIHFKNDWHNK